MALRIEGAREKCCHTLPDRTTAGIDSYPEDRLAAKMAVRADLSTVEFCLQFPGGCA